jgi:hypothetical protein
VSRRGGIVAQRTLGDRLNFAQSTSSLLRLHIPCFISSSMVRLALFSTVASSRRSNLTGRNQRSTGHVP